jgi:hypothetical protein
MMKAIRTELCTDILYGDGKKVYDLPITKIKFSDDIIGIESCWELSDEELKDIIKTKRIYFLCISESHPPIALSTKSFALNPLEIKKDEKK